MWNKHSFGLRDTSSDFGQSSIPKHYLSDLSIFIRTIGDKPPEAVTAEDVDAFVDAQIAEGLSPATINRRLMWQGNRTKNGG
jgi:hypothetical protein